MGCHKARARSRSPSFLPARSHDPVPSRAAFDRPEGVVGVSAQIAGYGGARRARVTGLRAHGRRDLIGDLTLHQMQG